MRPGSQNATSGVEDRPEVENTITSNPKRRSRSAGALRDEAREHRMSPIQWERPRGDVIKQLRDSVIDQPLRDVSGSRPQTGQTRDTQDEGDSQFVVQQPTTVEHDPPFDFGNLMGTMQTTEAVSLEQRVTTVEVKLIDLEYAIAKVQGYETPSFQPVVLEKPPKRRAHSPSSAAGTSVSAPPPTTFLSSPGESPKVADRPTSIATTLRPQTALQQPSSPGRTSPSPSEAGFTNEHFNTLMNMIKREQAARKKLEIQVLQLQKEVQELRSPLFAHVKSSTYPTPSPDSHDPSPLQRQAGGGSAGGGSAGSRIKEIEGDETDTDDGFLDVYETPTEAREHKYSMEGVQRGQVIGMI